VTKPLARVRVVQSVTARNALGKKIAGAGAAKLYREANAIGADAVKRCNAIVAAEMVNDRIPERRRPGRHLLGSFQYEIVGDPAHLPVSIRVFSSANPAKVNALMSGAKPHRITANEAFLVFPRGNASTSISADGVPTFSTRRGKGQVHQAYTGKGKSMTKVQSVNHPGNAPHHVMQRALTAAAKARLG